MAKPVFLDTLAPDHFFQPHRTARSWDGDHLLRGDLQHGASTDVHEIQLPRGHQRVDGSFTFERAMKFPKKISSSA